MKLCQGCNPNFVYVYLFQNQDKAHLEVRRFLLPRNKKIIKQANKLSNAGKNQNQYSRWFGDIEYLYIVCMQRTKL